MVSMRPHVRRGWSWLRREMDERDVHMYVGIVLVGVGVAWMHVAWALVVVGCGLFYVGTIHPLLGAWLLARRSERRE